MSDDPKLLDAYSSEMALSRRISLAELIDSHRVLGSLNLERNKELCSVLQLARTAGEAEAREYAIRHDLLHRDQLRAMTIAELANYLNEGKQ